MIQSLSLSFWSKFLLFPTIQLFFDILWISKTLCSSDLNCLKVTSHLRGCPSAKKFVRQGPCFRERFRLHYVLKIQEYHLTLETIEWIFWYYISGVYTKELLQYEISFQQVPYIRSARELTQRNFCAKVFVFGGICEKGLTFFL